MKDKYLKKQIGDIEVIDYIGYAEKIVNWLCKEINNQEKEKRRPRVKA